MSRFRKSILYVIEVIALLMLLSTFFIVYFNYQKLPDKIPNHFTFGGIPTDENGKESIWLLPVVSGLIYFMLTTISFLISYLKRPDELTTVVMGLVSGLLRQLKLLFSILFFILAYGTILISTGKVKSLGIAFSPVFLLSIAAVILINVILIIRKQREAPQ